VITPERPLRAVTAMITGLHEPRATHLAMVRQVIAAAGGNDPASQLDSAYRAAREQRYLWHEFGDSHLIIGE
jgi:S-adenosylmethionine:tRNA ribosyltransferase-isomerase